MRIYTNIMWKIAKFFGRVMELFYHLAGWNMRRKNRKRFGK